MVVARNMLTSKTVTWMVILLLNVAVFGVCVAAPSSRVLLGAVKGGDEGLSLIAAEHLALSIDHQISRADAMQRSFSARAVAADTLPDPKLKFGVVNVPAGSFKLDQEPMTQSVIGISQVFPPSGLTQAKANLWNALSDGQQAALIDRKFEVKRQVRHAWLELYFQHKAHELLVESESVFEQLAKITQFQYRAGRGNQQHVVRAQLELSLLKDREIAIETNKERALVGLKKWIGATEGKLSMSFPELPPVPNVAIAEVSLGQHPALRVVESEVLAARHNVKAEESRYKPSWMLDVTYGVREADYDDMLTAVVKVDLPFFTGSRQDKLVDAGRATLMARQSSVREKHRVLLEKLDSSSATYQHITERLKYFESMLLPQAKQNTEAALNAYQSGVSDFGELVRARLTELDSRLKHLRLLVDRAKSQVDLLYLSGGSA